MTGVVGDFPICSTMKLNVSALCCLVIEIELIREGEGILRKMEGFAVSQCRQRDISPEQEKCGSHSKLFSKITR
jgi:hypothetical protein